MTRYQAHLASPSPVARRGAFWLHVLADAAVFVFVLAVLYIAVLVVAAGQP